ncbi:MAG: TRAP transporter small permease [Rhodobacteraceae bacterium]|nr:TRAP transporter small permease [Paracoccaceae bacterium]PHR55908.1 MAG: hypothetical protein COA47_13525 [Robiginitomaculum sp.]
MIDRITRLLGLICTVISGAAFIFMALIAFVDSIGRQLNKPLLGASEYVELALLIFFFASIPIVYRDDSHIRVGLFSDLYSKKIKRFEYRFTGILEVIGLSAFAYMIFDQANRLERFGTLSSHFRIPMSPFIYAAFAMCLAAVWFGIMNLRKAPPPDEEHHQHAIPDGDF